MSCSFLLASRARLRRASVTRARGGGLPIECQPMPVRRQPRASAAVTSQVWPSGGRHLWPSGGTSSVHAHARGHLVYAASGVLAVHTERGTSIVPANRVAWTPTGFTHDHRAHGETDMRIVFLLPSLARLVPHHPVVFLASALAREVVLALTGRLPWGTDEDSAPPDSRYDRSARSRLLRVLVDEPAKLPNSPCSCRSRRTTDSEPSPGCCTRNRRTTRHWPSSGGRSEPAPAPSAGCSATSSA